MGYKDYFTKVKWSKLPSQELAASGRSDDGDPEGESDDTLTLLEKEQKPVRSKLLRLADRLMWLLHISLLAANITWWLTWSSWMHPSDNYTPVPKKYIEYEWSNFNLSLIMDDPFIEPWNDVGNAAWKDFTEGGNMGSVVSTEYLESTGYESIPMPDGSGHWVYLEVYHDLHCLSYLRKVLYNSTNGLINDDSDPWMKNHIPHCLNVIRLKLMCHADLGIMTQRWVDGFYEPWLVYHSEHHQCKNWENIKAWAKEHSAAGHEIPLHPKEAQRTSDALNEPWFDPYNMTYIDGLCGNSYC